MAASASKWNLTGSNATVPGTLLLVALVVLAGCGGEPVPERTEQPAATEQSPTTTLSQKYPSLDSRLVGLVDAENRTRYADEHDLRVGNGSVLVVVELRENRSLPTSFDLDVDARHDRLVQVWTPIDRLVALAEHDDVSFVRPPREPVADSFSGFPHR